MKSMKHEMLVMVTYFLSEADTLLQIPRDIIEGHITTKKKV
jgi:hypothetical protein